jgi:hypothetical protein
LHYIVAISQFRAQIFHTNIPYKFQDFEDGGSLCRSEIHSHNLVQTNCTEPKVNCVKFEEFENKVKKDLVALSSAQLLIKLL